MVFTTGFSGGKGGRNGLETELRRLGATQKNGRPNHPQAQGKAGRFQQTLKKWLRAQLAQPAGLPQLQALLDAFADEYNQPRPHRSLPRRPAPAVAYQARPKATPGSRDGDTHDRVRTDRVHAAGTVTLRTGGRLHHIGAGRTYAGTSVLLIVQDLQIRIINAATGELLRELTLDPARDYQPTRRTQGTDKKTTSSGPVKQRPRTPGAGSRPFRCPETSQGAPSRIRTCAHGSGGRCSIP